MRQKLIPALGCSALVALAVLLSPTGRSVQGAVGAQGSQSLQGSQGSQGLQSQPARRPERAVPFTVGETLTYDVSWSNSLTAGTMVATVKEKKPSYNSVAYYIVAEGRPAPLLANLYKLYYKLDTLIDTQTLLSQRGSVYSEEGSRHLLRTTVFNRDARKASFEAQTTTLVKQEFVVPPNVQDALGALYAIRALPLRAGDRVTIPVSDSGTNFTVMFNVGAVEPVTVPFGNVNALKALIAISDATKQPVGKNLAIWFSTDRRQLPIKVQGDLSLGLFVLALRDAQQAAP